MDYTKENLFEDMADSIIRDCKEATLSTNAVRILITERLRRLDEMILRETQGHIRLSCAILDESCVACDEDCPEAGEKKV